MVISDAKIFACLPRSLKLRFNLLRPFPIKSLELFSWSDSVELEDFKCSDSPRSFCSVCDREFRRQNIFIKHLSKPFHQQKLSKLLPLSHELQSLSAPLGDPVKQNPEAVTSVFWDIKTYPVPRDCDPRRVGPCIKQFLKKKGYSGPLTITAIGVLTDVPNDILEGVYSSGVSLNNICSG
ncbi:PREDICTED: uncharacterized protein LOC104743104 [Camelina sativa]|uniref:Uncharacterized protein LOC104743104 n=1 Tax=Camelina sativa TaxID=90675 RepID=A0ABM1QXG1_CAMSA|nr:PREDICTED: uncharacterized protein LOC104743104 [Camelina sativa]